jgi:hypothetical protein
MEFENHKRQQKGLLLLEWGAVFVISLILFPVSERVKTVSATPITINDKAEIISISKRKHFVSYTFRKI